MDLIKKLYKAFEEKVSGSMRVLLVLAVAGVLLASILMVIIGAINANKEATLETDVNGLEYEVAKDLLFNQQIQVVEEKEEETEEEAEKVIPPRIDQIHKSIKKHFNDNEANREQFADKNRGLTPESLEGVLNYYAGGRYEIALFAEQQRVAIPPNNIGCIKGKEFPRLDRGQYNQMLDGMVEFWENAESGTSENASKFALIKRFDARLGTVYAANDLFLCGFANSLAALEDVNNLREKQAKEKNRAGVAMIGSAGSLMDFMFKFFAAFAIVFLSLILIKIEKALRK